MNYVERLNGIYDLINQSNICSCVKPHEYVMIGFRSPTNQNVLNGFKHPKTLPVL